MPLNMSDFRCTAINPSGVTVVFDQTELQYTFPWSDGVLELSQPRIRGGYGEHPPEIIECLARAVAYKASLNAPESLRPRF